MVFLLSSSHFQRSVPTQLHHVCVPSLFTQTFSVPPQQHRPVYPTPQGALFQKYVTTLTSELLPPTDTVGSISQRSMMDPNLKGSLSKLSMASTCSSNSGKEYSVPSTSGGTGRKISPWTAPVYGRGGSKSREASPASLDALSMDELDLADTTEAEDTIL